MRTPNTFIRSLGTVLPESIGVDAAVARGWYPAEAAKADGLLGAAVAGDVSAPDMGLQAARQAIQRCGVSPDDFQLLLYADSWHQGPDAWSPHYYLQHHLLGGDVLAAEVRQGCNGMFCALELAVAHLAGIPRDRDALIVTADNFGTPRIDRWRTGSGFILGDAAGALVLSRRTGFARLLAVASTTVPAGEELYRSGEPMFPPGATTGDVVDLSARVDNFVRLARAPSDVMMLWLNVHQKMVEIASDTLAEAGVAIDDVTRVAFTNLSPETVEQRCMQALGLPMSKSTSDFGRTVGHLGASDQIVSFEHLLSTGALAPGDHVLMAGLGSGVTLSCAVVEILEVPPWWDVARETGHPTASGENEGRN